MNFDEYQNLARRSANDRFKDSRDSKKDAILNWTLGIGGESGEILEDIKKNYYHDKPLQRAKIVSEMGDLLWYLSMLSFELEIPFSQIANANIEKLRNRYPEGFKTYSERINEGLEKEFGSH